MSVRSTSTRVVERLRRQPPPPGARPWVERARTALGARLVDLAEGLSGEIALRAVQEGVRRVPAASAGHAADRPGRRVEGGGGGAPVDLRGARLETALGSALDDGGLHLVGQPVVSCENGRLHGVETLLRWTHPQLGAVRPDEFVPVAERSGAIDAIGRWVVNEACRAMAQMERELADDMRLAVNVSPRQLLHPAFAQAVGDALDAHGVAPARLVLEITETALLGRDPTTERTLAQLRELGATLVLDDFGTGFSSLSMLKERPIDGIKIDRSFVHGLPGDTTSAAIVSGVVGMARALGRTVTAEGIETPEQLAYLCDLGCDYAQGYFLGRPAPFAALPSWAPPAAAPWTHAARA